MHGPADAVARKVADDPVSEALGIGLNGAADIAQVIAVDSLAHALVEALLP